MITNKLDSITKNVLNRIFGESSSSQASQNTTSGPKQWADILGKEVPKLYKDKKSWTIDENGTLVFVDKVCRFMKDKIEERTGHVVEMFDVMRIEISASGHSDYMAKLARGCAELEYRIISSKRENAMAKGETR